MKKRTASAKKKAAKPRRKTIMRHSREGVKAGKAARPAKSKSKSKSKAKVKAKAKAKRPAKPGSRVKKTTRKSKPAARAVKARTLRRSGNAGNAGNATKAVKSAKMTKRTPVARPRRGRGGADMGVESPSDARGLGADAGGQSGDTEGLSRSESADSESVEELVEEGQAFEAGIISGVENAPDADKGGVRTRQVPEDDVPREYLHEKK